MDTKRVTVGAILMFAGWNLFIIFYPLMLESVYIGFFRDFNLVVCFATPLAGLLGILGLILILSGIIEDKKTENPDIKEYESGIERVIKKKRKNKKYK